MGLLGGGGKERKRGGGVGGCVKGGGWDLLNEEILPHPHPLPVPHDVPTSWAHVTTLRTSKVWVCVWVKQNDIEESRRGPPLRNAQDQDQECFTQVTRPANFFFLFSFLFRDFHHFPFFFAFPDGQASRPHVPRGEWQGSRCCNTHTPPPPPRKKRKNIFFISLLPPFPFPIPTPPPLPPSSLPFGKNPRGAVLLPDYPIINP